MITRELLDALAEAVRAEGPGDDVVSSLRSSFPDLNITACYDDDVINAKPVLEDPTFNLYLVGSGEGCVKLTDDFDSATGVVVAEVIPDDD